MILCSSNDLSIFYSVFIGSAIRASLLSSLLINGIFSDGIR